MTVSGAVTVGPRPARRNFGRKSSRSSAMNVLDVVAKYSKKVRLLLQNNKQLTRKLAASQDKISKQEKANEQQQKIENLALPRIKVWLEAGLQCIRDARVNYERAMGLLQDIMTPERDFTLIDEADTDEPSARQDRRPPLRPKGRPRANERGNVAVIPEETEECLSTEMTELDTGVSQSQTPTVLMSSFLPKQLSPAIPEKASTSRAGDEHTLEAKAASKKSSKKSRVCTSSAGLGRTLRLSRDLSEGKQQVHASRPGNLWNGPPSAGSAETPCEVENAKPPPAELQTAKTSRRRPRLRAEPIRVSLATDDDSVPPYSSGRPARKCTSRKN